MTFDDYMNEVMVRRMHGLAPQQRAGQFYFNVLSEFRPKLARKLKNTELDPSRSDSRLPEFLTYLGRHWND